MGARRRDRWWPVLGGATAALAVAALWVVLTAWTGRTFHFYPAIVAAVPVFLVRRVAGGPIARPVLLGLLVAGLGAVVTGWLLLSVLDVRPTATFVHGQWGGVELEVVAFAMLGAGLAIRTARGSR